MASSSMSMIIDGGVSMKKTPGEDGEIDLDFGMQKLGVRPFVQKWRQSFDLRWSHGKPGGRCSRQAT